MSRNGSGTYTLPAGNPVTTGTTISSTWANNTLNDIASALTGSIASDGQTTPSANLPMGGYNHTNVANATLRTQYASAGQVEDGTLNYLTSVSGTDTITATAPVSMSAYVAGQTFRFIAAGANTGAVTLNLNAIGAKSVVKTDGSALVSGDIASGGAVQVMYDGTNFQLLSDSNGASETVTTLTATTKVVTPQIGSSSGSFTIQSANTTAITIDSSQNVGIGVTPSAWSSSGFLNLPAGTGVWAKGTENYFGSNAYYNAGWKYATTGYASYYYQNTSGQHLWYTAPSGTAGNAITFTESMRIDSSGNVGIGTASPAYKLDVNGIAKATNFYIPTAGGYVLDTSGATGIGVFGSPSYLNYYTGGVERMRIDSSGKVLIATSSSSGAQLDVIDNTGNNNYAITIARSSTDASSKSSAMSIRHWLNAEEPVCLVGAGIDGNTNNDVRIGGGFSNLNSATSVAFYTAANNATLTGTERMRIDSSGNLGVGTTNPTVGATATSSFVVRPGNNDTWISHASGVASGTGFMWFSYNSAAIGGITQNGTTGVLYNITSDQRLKENIVDAPSALDKIDSVKVRSFDFKSDGSHVEFGTIAQELYEVAPECVAKGDDGEEIEQTWGVDTSVLVPAMIKAIQELSTKVTALEAQLGAK